MFSLLATYGRARLGRLELPHATFETPMFMPVGPQAPVKGVTVGQLEKICGCHLLYTADVPLIPNVEKLLDFAGPVKLDWRKMHKDDRVSFTFVPPGSQHTYIGVAAPVSYAGQPFGAVVMAKPLADVNRAWTKVAGRVAGLVLRLRAAARIPASTCASPTLSARRSPAGWPSTTPLAASTRPSSTTGPGGP